MTFAKERTRAPVPGWWAEAIVDVDHFPGQHHGFIGSGENTGPKLKESRAGFAVPKGAELEELEGRLKYSVGGRAVEFPKEALGDGFVSGTSGPVGEKRSVMAAYFGIGGGGFPVFGLDGMGGKPTWKSGVWAANRAALGGVTHHWVELVARDDTVYLFGAESHGMYMEAFDIETGKCRFCFCACYWFTFSETWGLK